jgi:glutathione S-transferase
VTSGGGAAPCTLVTIPISHYCEKARWALERCGVPYRERAHLQVIHWLAVKRAGGGRTAPVLVCGSTVLSESADIVAFADSRATGQRLYPDDAAEVRALESDFDERLGPHGRRWMYDELRGQTHLVRKYGATGVPAWERRALPLAFPLVSRVIDRYLDITPESSAASLQTVRDVFTSVGERLSDGRRYLAGDRFTAADLAFAALAAPLLVPRGYGVPLPDVHELPGRMATVVRELRDHPAGRHALEMYRSERRPS